MAPHRLFTHWNRHQVSRSHFNSVFRGRSKTQMCLHKILRLISASQSLNISKETSPSRRNLESQSDEESSCLRNVDRALLRRDSSRGLDIDLNFRIGPSPVIEESESPAVSTDLKSSEGECDCPEIGAEKAEEPELGGVMKLDESGIVNLKNRSSRNEDCGVIVESEGKEKEESEVEEVFNTDESEITNLQFQSSRFDECGGFVESNLTEKEEPEINGVSKPDASDTNGVSAEFKGDEDCKIEVQSEENEGEGSYGAKTKSFSREVLRSEEPLELLLEAAKLIFGETDDGGEDLVEARAKRRRNDVVSGSGDYCREENPTVIATETSPLVRSKRGRSLVLPYRYRDSVLEPLNKRFPRQKSVTTKRRSR